jgi:hypothetical protein
MYRLRLFKMSLTLVTGWAPSWINLLAPAPLGEKMLWGIAKTSRPCARAEFAVISAPLRSGASVMRTPSERPLIMWLRAGKLPVSGLTPNGKGVSSAPCSESTMRLARLWLDAG